MHAECDIAVPTLLVSRSIQCQYYVYKRMHISSHFFDGAYFCFLSPTAVAKIQVDPSEEALNVWGAKILQILPFISKTIKVSHGSVYTVVRAMQQVNVKWQFCGCQNSVTPEPID